MYEIKENEGVVFLEGKDGEEPGGVCYVYLGGRGVVAYVWSSVFALNGWDRYCTTDTHTSHIYDKNTGISARPPIYFTSSSSSHRPPSTGPQNNPPPSHSSVPTASYTTKSKSQIPPPQSPH